VFSGCVKGANRVHLTLGCNFENHFDAENIPGWTGKTSIFRKKFPPILFESAQPEFYEQKIGSIRLNLILTNSVLSRHSYCLKLFARNLRWGWVFLERTRIFSGIQFTTHFIEIFVVKTKRFVGSFVNVILTRQTCGQRSSRAAESKRRALGNYFH